LPLVGIVIEVAPGIAMPALVIPAPDMLKVPPVDVTTVPVTISPAL